MVRFSGSARVHEIKDCRESLCLDLVDDPRWIEVVSLPSFFERQEVRRSVRIAGFVLVGLCLLAAAGVFLQRRRLRRLQRRNEELELRVAERTEELREALERERSSAW